jgi:hypothetical protein
VRILLFSHRTPIDYTGDVALALLFSSEAGRVRQGIDASVHLDLENIKFLLCLP